MPYIQLDDKQFPLRAGEARIGGAGAEIPLPALGSSSAVVAVLATGGGDAVIRRVAADATTAEVRVNGVRLGAEPTPLLHGDRIEVAGAELLYGDERGASSTQSLSASEVRSRLGEPSANGSRRETRRTAATGGRLVSLVDGREYAVPAEGITIGRDASCDVVVPTGDVSRRHAVIAPGADGYEVRDTSTNGVFVNEERVTVVRQLGRGDVLQIGDAQFRFYADAAAPSPAAPDVEPQPAAAAATPAALSAPFRDAIAAAPAPLPPPPVASPADHRSEAVPGAAPAAQDTRPALATLEIINQGMLRGRRFVVRSALTHIGRGAHNDVVVPDESVSDTHAKLQKREAGWYVVDMDSTNGTYVAGTRIVGEQRLVGTPDVRFGGVKMIFQPAAAGGADASGTRAIARRDLVAEPAPPAVAASAPADVDVPEPGRAGARWFLLAILAAVAGFVAVYFLRQGR
ncbi:MAG TPA: FHA domain-containing protein [Gemmatimonadaceae bacterium]|nr:FHA domain-containing protein [Gemmatimonadaceae bacterium]